MIGILSGEYILELIYKINIKCGKCFSPVKFIFWG